MDLLKYFSPETWTLLVALVTLFVIYLYWPYGIFKKMGIPGPTPVPLFGTMLAYRKGFLNFDMDCFKKYGKMWGIYDGRQPVLCVADPAMVKTILVKECYSLFTNRRNFRLNGPLYDAVSIAEDEQWRRIRSVLSPSFTSGRLKEMFDIMKNHSETLVKNMKKKADKDEPIELKEYFGPYAMDVVTSTAFSVEMDSLNNPSDPFVTNIKKMLKFDLFSPLFLAVAFFPFLGPVFEKMEFSFFPVSVTDFFYASLQKIKLNREASKQKSRVDFLQLMIDSQKHYVPNDPEHEKGELKPSIHSFSSASSVAGSWEAERLPQSATPLVPPPITTRCCRDVSAKTVLQHPETLDSQDGSHPHAEPCHHGGCQPSMAGDLSHGDGGIRPNILSLCLRDGGRDGGIEENLKVFLPPPNNIPSRVQQPSTHTVLAKNCFPLLRRRTVCQNLFKAEFFELNSLSVESPVDWGSARCSQQTLTARLGLTGFLPCQRIQRSGGDRPSTPLFTRVSEARGRRSDDTTTKLIIDLGCPGGTCAGGHPCARTWCL